MAKVGQENASLVKVILRFQRTRMIFSALVGVLAMVAVFVGPVISSSYYFFLTSTATLLPVES